MNIEQCTESAQRSIETGFKWGLASIAFAEASSFFMSYGYKFLAYSSGYVAATSAVVALLAFAMTEIDIRDIKKQLKSNSPQP